MGSPKKDAMGNTCTRAARGINCTWQWMWAVALAGFMVVYILSSISSSNPCLEDSAAGKSLLRRSSASDSNPDTPWHGDLRRMESAWNRLCFGALPLHRLRIALFVKKWPVGGVPGGLERHALTLHLDLARRGHEVHVYTSSPADQPFDTVSDTESGVLHVHFFQANSGGTFDYNSAWERFVADNSSSPFDIVHSESVALPHFKAALIPSLAASWHGIGYEIIHSDLVQDLIRKPGELRTPDIQRALTERLVRVADEIRFFPSYRHHVATSDYVSDVLRTIYQIPQENVHTVLNGVDAVRFSPNPSRGNAFRLKFGVPSNASLVFGAAGRLVKDKGHPLLFEAMSRIVHRHPGVYLLVAGHGPWGERYRELAPNVKTLGPMNPSQLTDFYNSLDVFVNPTLRSQGLDHTLLEAMQCGKPLLATHFSSITWSVVVSEDLGFTFSPSVDSLVNAMETVIKTGKEKMRGKGDNCRRYAGLMFTAEKMGAAYERLFLCMKNDTYCRYPLPGDCPVQPSKY